MKHQIDLGARHRIQRCASSILLLAALAASSAFSASAASAADPGVCTGPWVRGLGGPHAVVSAPIRDSADLRARLAEMEASIRFAVNQDPSLGPVVADALIATLRDSERLSQRQMTRDEALLWMAYQPKPGQMGVISPACLKLDHSYDAFEITVEIPDRVATAPVPTCVVSASRNCASADPVITVDLGGSSPGAQVTMSLDGRPGTAVDGAGEIRTIRDPGPFESEATFTVRAQGAVPPQRTARVFRFLMPKICGNLAYLGEAPRRTLTPQAAPASCEQSARVERCIAPAIAPINEPEAEVADSCEVADWTLRPFVFALSPRGSELTRDIELASGPARERFDVGDGYGLGLSLERRISSTFGIEGAALFGRAKTTYNLDSGGETGEVDHTANFYALTIGPNFHLLPCRSSDLYVGLFAGFGGLADPIYRTLGHRFQAQFDGTFLWGAQAGLDIPFHADSDWGMHFGARYLKLDQDTDAGSIDVDPLVLELGLSRRF